MEEKAIKLLDQNGRPFGVQRDGNRIETAAITKFFTGTSIQTGRIDPLTFSMETITVQHGEAHKACLWSAFVREVDFDKASEIGVLFTTGNTAKHAHVVSHAYCGVSAIYEILEIPTLDTGNYPTTFFTPFNRQRNSGNPSLMRSVRAAPVANQMSIKGKTDTTPVSGDGTILQGEMIGSGKQGGGGSSSDREEWILRQNTTYYYRLKGITGGADNSVGSVILVWYEHAANEKIT